MEVKIFIFNNKGEYINEVIITLFHRRGVIYCKLLLYYYKLNDIFKRFIYIIIINIRIII